VIVNSAVVAIIQRLLTETLHLLQHTYTCAYCSTTVETHTLCGVAVQLYHAIQLFHEADSIDRSTFACNWTAAFSSDFSQIYLLGLDSVDDR
jgi:hypothetical protein